MMRIIIVSILLTISITIKAQILNLHIGISNSRIDWDGLTFEQGTYDKPVTMLYAAVGIDYLQKKNFNLSSNVGYLVRGGKGMITYKDAIGNTLLVKEEKMLYKYITLNTLLQLNATGKKVIPFVEAGPRVDFRTDYNKVLYGGLGGIGIKFNIGSRFQSGAKGNYYFNFNQLFKGGNYKVTDKTYTVNAFIGLKL